MTHITDLNHAITMNNFSITELNYARCIHRLRNELKGDDGLDFLLNTQPVIDWIETTDYAHNTKKMYYIAIVAILKRDELLYKEPLVVYRDKMSEYNDKQTEIYNKQQLSENELPKYLDWASVLAVRDTIYDSIEDVFDFQDYLIVCLYTMIAPMRLDYADMRVLKSEPDTISGNYLINSEKPYFIFSEYKTAKKYGVVRMPLPKPLVAVISEWLGYLVDSEYLLINRDLQPMSAPSLGGKIISIFEKFCQKKVGVAILRHSFISHKTKGQKSIKKSQELASSMCHSVGVQQIYRKL